MKNLDAFLQEQSSGLFDSTGEFTIAADKALEKLAHSQLPNASYWVLKMMQFATSWQATSGNVRIGKRVSSVELELPHPVSVEQIRQGLGAVDPLADPGLESLVTALRAIGAMEKRCFGLQLTSPERIQNLLYDGERLSMSESDEGSETTSLLLEIATSDPSAWSKLVNALAVGHRMEELHLLSEKAFTLPFPLQVDGRLPQLDYFLDPKKFRQPVLCDFSPQEPGFTLPHLISDLVRSMIEGAAGTAIRRKFSKTPWSASAFWNITFNYSLNHKMMRLSPDPLGVFGPSRVHWLRDGVVVEVERLQTDTPEYSVDVFVDASECTADLGGLKIRKTEEFQRKRVWVQSLLGQIVKSANNDIPTASRLVGKTLSGWDSFALGTTHLPINQSLKYTSPSRIAKPLSETTGFRKKLLKLIRETELAPLSFVE